MKKKTTEKAEAQPMLPNLGVVIVDKKKLSKETNIPIRTINRMMARKEIPFYRFPATGRVRFNLGRVLQALESFQVNAETR